MKSSAAHIDSLPQCEIHAVAGRFADTIRRSKRPVLLTHAGKQTGVAMPISNYEALLEEIETLKDIHTALAQVSRGKSTGHSIVSQRLRKRLGDEG
ncbi:MAG: hypothetical protein FJY92_07780 [Candidatus Hydrogenedentes bacterium]|nr:hypothetical protein [Candidatus Hydrogenedentota bacterium]